jgi:hypothetical protein
MMLRLRYRVWKIRCAGSCGGCARGNPGGRTRVEYKKSPDLAARRGSCDQTRGGAGVASLGGNQARDIGTRHFVKTSTKSCPAYDGCNAAGQFLYPAVTLGCVMACFQSRFL